jgi:hypothetical protein
MRGFLSLLIAKGDSSARHALLFKSTKGRALPYDLPKRGAPLFGISTTGYYINKKSTAAYNRAAML